MSTIELDLVNIAIAESSDEPIEDSMNALALHSAITHLVVIYFSVGGPSVRLEAKIDRNNDIVDAWLIGQWGAEEETMPIEIGSQAFRAVELFAGRIDKSRQEG